MRHFLFVIAHTLSIALILKLISFVLPKVILGYYMFIFNALLCVTVSYITFFSTKRKFLTAKIKASDKAVFITGCDSGFGNLLAQRLDSLGFHVFAGCLFPSGTGATDLQKNCSQRLHVLEVDVTKDESVKRAAQIVKDDLGSYVKLWAIVNNAGIQKGFTVELTPFEWFQEVLDVNTYGHIRVSKAFLPSLRQSRGRIVNITSVAGQVPHPHLTPYCVSKYASQAFNDCLRIELSNFGVDVISIEPQAFQSAITNPNRIRKAFDIMLDTVPEDVFEIYKGKYIARLEALQELFNQTTSPDTHLVIADLEAAITSVYPSSSYQTRCNMFNTVIWKFMELLPTCGQDLIFRMIEVLAPMLVTISPTSGSEPSKLK